MVSNADGIAGPDVPRNREIIVAFAPEQVKAPFFLRCGALLLDYVLIVAFPVVCLLLGRVSGDDGAKLLNGDWNSAGWLIAILFAVADLVLLPAFSGQSIGKIAAGLRIVKLDGTPASTGTILLRQTVGYLITLLTGGIGFMISVFSSKGRALHDYLTGTVVIYAERNVRP
jgi:uncharacterized RDD family membrane protein YckC